MIIPNHITREYKGIVLERLKNLPPGGKMGDLPPHLQHESFIRKGIKKTGGPNMRLLRLTMDDPSLTVTAYIFNKFVHPTEHRYITPREAACLQDFPIDFEFKGTLGQIQKQIGNAVPVKLAEAIARQVSSYFKKNNMLGNIKVFSYFTGAGGLDLGFESAGDTKSQFQTAICTDIEKWSEQTINQNRPSWNFVRGDIKSISPSEVGTISGLKPDVIIGGPPCQPFSVAGKQKATHDPLGVLYRDYVKHIAYFKPELVVMENVYGLAQVKSVNMVSEIYKAFHDIGYNVVHKELNAADFGTPQKRRRLFFVASKTFHNFKLPQPTHCEQDNLLGLPKYNGAGRSFAQLKEPLLYN